MQEISIEEGKAIPLPDLNQTKTNTMSEKLIYLIICFLFALLVTIERLVEKILSNETLMQITLNRITDPKLNTTSN